MPFSEVGPYAEIRRDASSGMSFSGWTKTCTNPASAPPSSAGSPSAAIIWSSWER
jgi:hypothetical protein